MAIKKGFKLRGTQASKLQKFIYRYLLLVVIINQDLWREILIIKLLHFTKTITANADTKIIVVQNFTLYFNIQGILKLNTIFIIVMEYLTTWNFIVRSRIELQILSLIHTRSFLNHTHLGHKTAPTLNQVLYNKEYI